MKQPCPDMYQMDEADTTVPRSPASWCEVALAIAILHLWGWMVIPGVHYFLNRLFAVVGCW